jgi:hypothetical protein
MEWKEALIIIIGIICLTIIMLNFFPYPLNINFSMTMDNNTLEAFKSINYTMMNVK